MNKLTTTLAEQQVNCRSLNELAPGERAVIISVPDNPLIYPLGLRPNKSLYCLGRQLFGGPVLVKVGDRQVALSRILAEKIVVSNHEHELIGSREGA